MSVPVEQLLAILQSGDQEQFNRAAEELARQQVPPPPPGSLDQAAAFFAQAGANPDLGAAAPLPPGLGSILGQGPVPTTPPISPGGPAVPGEAQSQQQAFAQAAGALQPRRQQTPPLQAPFIGNLGFGAASQAQPLILPQALTPQGQGIPPLGRYL